eukprot:CAMPEP_0177588776 /NCGR_PEP_ID=MMETSP0419_2-20121207/6416_1 /TAXON_ID=582737 /ORGANISM="Tetraselmis sp., Strain GSL018" /LENGTH=238 /DNA_ID=CAMNT_0019079017 /DNA_START=119 /DNA_END=837 /DNA_ORIENTATION=+
MASTRVYVGNLDPRVTEQELEDQFTRFGTLRSVWVARKPPGFAFLDYNDPRDAEDAVREINGKYGGVWNFHGLTVDGEALGEAGALDLLAAAVNAGATSAMRWGTLQETAGYVREGLLVAGALHGTGPRHPGGPGVLIGDEGAHTGGRQVLVVEAVTGATAQLAAGAGAMTAGHAAEDGVRSAFWLSCAAHVERHMVQCCLICACLDGLEVDNAPGFGFNACAFCRVWLGLGWGQGQF